MARIKHVEACRVDEDEWAGAINDGYSLFDLRKIALYIIRSPDQKGIRIAWIGRFENVRRN